MKKSRIIRIVTAAAVTSGITFAFIDFHEVLPHSVRSALLFLQPGPSFINFITAPALAASGFIIIILSAIIAGRLFCSFLCPLGALQDIAPVSRKKKYTYSSGHQKLHYTILAVTGITVILWGTVIFQWIDPFSIYGRLAGYAAAPAAVIINNAAGSFFSNMGIYSIPVINYKSAGLFAAAAALTPVIVIFLLSSAKGRLYCNTICPIGAVLAITSRFSLFRIKIDSHKCISCGKCENVCKSSCIDYRNHYTDYSRCVACFNCIDQCPNGSIAFSGIKPSPGKKDSPSQVTRDMTQFTPAISREKFLAGLMLLPSGFLLASQQNQELYYKDEASQVKFSRKDIATAPGSLNSEHFNSACTACSLCVSVCPTGVLQPAVLQYGLTGITQPFMDYSSGYCNYDCVKCGEACPSGAIKPLNVEAKRSTKIGEVYFIKENCITYTDGIVCGACSEHCPTKAVYMKPFRDNLVIPETNPDICIGCGACEYVCPVRPVKAIYVNGFPSHGKAVKPDDAEQNIIVEDEFPF